MSAKPVRSGSTPSRRAAAGAPPAAPTRRPARAPEPSPAPRQPQQERGQRRVEAILDATAALIREEGIAAVTMHGVAQRSGTTTGSMYHFFPDRAALLRALVARHARALRERMLLAERDAPTRWARLSTPEAVDAYLDPFLRYADEHPDLLPLARFTRSPECAQGRDAELDALVVRSAEALVASRDPAASRREVTVRAITVMAIADGMIGVMAGAMPLATRTVPTAVLRRELRRALVAYLESFRTASRRAGKEKAR